MGADGYQGVAAHEIALPLGGRETFVRSEFHRVDANHVINDTNASAFAGAHSDIRKPAVAALIAAAARSSRPGLTAAGQRSCLLSTLPLAVLGKSATTCTSRGALNVASRALHQAASSSGLGCEPGRGMTNALTLSPR